MTAEERAVDAFLELLLACYELDIASLAHILKELAEDGVVHQFEEVLLSIVGCNLTSISIVFDVLGEPFPLLE